MGEIGSTTSIRPLIDALHKSTSRWVRRESALALGRIGTDRVVEPLDTAMRTDPDTSVRKYAARGLYLALAEKAIPYFQSALAIEKDPGCVQALRWLCDVEFKGTQAPVIAAGEISYGSLEGMLYKIYTPKSYTPTSPCGLLVSVHGTDGTPDAYASMCRATADRESCLVLAPYFDAFNFPLYDMLCTDGSGVRSDQRLLQIIDSLPQIANVKVDRFFLFGHSKGGQFVLRFVMAHPDRILRAAACAFGNAVMPDGNGIFPMGPKPNAMMPDLAAISFTDLVSAKMAVVVGSKDVNKPLVEQFAMKAQQYAREQAKKSKIQLFVVPDGIHAGTSNFPTASQFLFGR
jgi:pimeloyl-ACP methyl ester carboxylesterase